MTTVRADESRDREGKSLGTLGRVVTALLSLGLGAASVVYAFLAGLYGPPEDGQAVGLAARGLVVSAVCGLAAVGCARLAAGKRGATWWFLVGLVPAAVQVVRLLAT
jgi:hypothetical protein